MIESYNPQKIEEEVLHFWQKEKIYQKAKDQNQGKKHFYFLDGPPYTSGKVHIGTAWNKALKDALIRFKRMNGLNIWDRAGYDMHGLPTAHKVEEKFGIRFKEEIPKFGIDRYINECRKHAEDNLALM